MKNNSKFKFCIIILSTIWCIFTISLLILMASFNEPIADQYSFMSEIHTYGILGYTGIMYSTWSGRLLQTPLLGLAYKFFGDFGAQIFLPLILLAALGLAFSWLAYQIIKPSTHRCAYALLLGFLLASGTLFTTSCLFDIYLWLDAAVVYLLGLVAIIYDLALAVWLARHAGELSKHKFLLLALFIPAILLQTAGETSMVITLGWSFVALAASCIVKKWHRFRTGLGLLFAALLAGSLIMALAPGLWDRAGYIAEDTSYLELFIRRPLATIKDLFLGFSAWQGITIFAIALALSHFVPGKVSGKTVKWAGIVSFLVLISLLYFPLAIFFYGSRSYGVESRALAVPCLGIFLSFTGFFAVLFKYLSQKFSARPAFTYAYFAIFAIAICFSGVSIFNFSRTYLSALITRGNLVATREALIKKYQNGELSQLDLPDAPIMIANSGATDFTSNGWVNVGWFYDSIINYYDLDPANVTVHGEELVLPESKLPWYTESGRTICTNAASSIIYEKYYCNN